MNVLLDTCALISLSNGPLSPDATRAFGQATEAYVSPVSAWEVSIKSKLGKLHLSQPPLQWYEALCRHYHLTELPLRTELLCAAADLPLIHRDPFDRVLVAIAQQQNLTILTSDQVIPTYPGVSAVW